MLALVSADDAYLYHDGLVKCSGTTIESEIRWCDCLCHCLCLLFASRLYFVCSVLWFCLTLNAAIFAGFVIDFSILLLFDLFLVGQLNFNISFSVPIWRVRWRGWYIWPSLCLRSARVICVIVHAVNDVICNLSILWRMICVFSLMCVVVVIKRMMSFLFTVSDTFIWCVCVYGYVCNGFDRFRQYQCWGMFFCCSLYSRFYLVLFVRLLVMMLLRFVYKGTAQWLFRSHHGLNPPWELFRWSWLEASELFLVSVQENCFFNRQLSFSFSPLDVRTCVDFELLVSCLR